MKDGGHLNYLNVDWRVTDIKEAGCEFVDWITLSQKRFQCRDLVNTVMNLRV